MKDFAEGSFELPPEVEGQLACGNWRYWMHLQSPFVGWEPAKCRIKYADWLKSDGYPVSGKGVYVWLARRPGGEGFRFVHVGISAKGSSSLAKRTEVHIRNQFTVDRVHELTATPGDQGFGCLGEAISDPDRRRDVANRFLASLRVLYLIPVGATADDARRIRNLEGVIARAASRMFSRKDASGFELEITNTLSRVARYDALGKDAHFIKVAKALNGIEPMLPEAPM